MARFKVNDLMINIMSLSGRGQVPFCGGVTLRDCAFYTFPPLVCAVTICPEVTRCQVTLPNVGECDACVTSGGVSTGGCGAGTGPKLVADNELHLEDLIILKQQLKQSLAKVEAQERTLEASLQPQTLEEVEVLEKKLTAALGELKALKGELGRATPKKKR